VQYKNRKNFYKIIFITILLGFIISLVGCNWLSLGLLNVFDPQAQVRLNYTQVNLEEGSISLEIYSLNEAEFIGTGFEYEYYNGTTKITSLDKMVGVTFYVAPSTSPGTPGPITKIDNMPLYFQEVLDYLTLNPLVTELTCNITMVGTDGAGHSLSETVTVDLPALQPGIDFVPPTAVINVTPGTTGEAPFSVVLDASSSTDDRGIASYGWSFGDGTTGSGDLISHTYVNSGSYIIVLTVTDYYGNKGYATEIITVGDAGDAGGPTANIQVTPGTTGTVPFTVAFDASGSAVSSESDCSCSITSYGWDFGDTSTGSGIATTHTYTTAGTYIVILTVTDSNGKVGYATVVITVTSEEETDIDTITVSANPETNVPGGTSTIFALVINTEGDAVPNGTTVYFYTNSGVLSAASADTTNGIATVTLTLDANMQGGDEATVTAFIGSVNGNVKVTCVEESEIGSITVNANPESNITGGDSNIIAIVTNTEGDVVPDGTTVYFYTNNGVLSAESSSTTNGIATVTLTLDNMQVGNVATVTAFIGLVSSNTEVSCIAGLITEEIALSANPESNVSGGASTITAIVTKKAGGFVDNGTTVYFYTNNGVLSAESSTTTNGIAIVTLTLDNMQVGDSAEVTAFTVNSESVEVNVDCIAGLITEEIALSANPESNVPGGVSTITAIVTKKAGGFVDNGTTVYFTTNSGVISADSVTTVGGVATVGLTLDDNMQAGVNAKVTAFTLNSESVEVTVMCIDVIVTIYANDYSIPAGGSSNITAVVTQTNGTPVKDVIVIFFAKDTLGNDIGTLTSVYCPTNASGIAATTLTLSTSGDIAIVTAKCGSRVSNPIVITCE
jgi:PKD repeat protein